VGDDHQGGSTVSRDTGQQIHHGGPGLLVEGASRFVGEHDGGPSDKGASDSDPLRLTPGQFTRPTLGEIGHSDGVEQFPGPGGRGASVLSVQHQREGDVLHGRQFRQQHSRLEDETEVPTT
jgi:hypothetical protein